MNALGKVCYYSFIAILFSLGAMLIATQVPVLGIELKIVKSGSMEPSIGVGSLIVVRAAPEYKLGDVITFGPDTKKQIPTTHRIVGVEGQGKRAKFTTRGDANDVDDGSAVAVREVIGKVIFTIPKLGYLLDFARTPVGFVFLVGIPAGLIIMDEIVVLIREIGKTKRGRGRKGGAREVRIRTRREPKRRQNSEREIRMQQYYQSDIERSAVVILRSGEHRNC